MFELTPYFIWIDLEMTGLDHTSDRIIEIATVITTPDLDHVADGPVFAIHQPNSALDAMDEWNTHQHGQSGLTERVRQSDVTEEDAESETLNFLKKYLSPNQSPMCGNSIGTDRRFLMEYMPTLAAFFHYRNLDVSTLKILAQHWAPNVAKGLVKHSDHLALADIHDAINELKYYREQLFLP